MYSTIDLYIVTCILYGTIQLKPVKLCHKISTEPNSKADFAFSFKICVDVLYGGSTRFQISFFVLFWTIYTFTHILSWRSFENFEWMITTHWKWTHIERKRNQNTSLTDLKMLLLVHHHLSVKKVPERELFINDVTVETKYNNS